MRYRHLFESAGLAGITAQDVIAADSEYTFADGNPFWDEYGDDDEQGFAHWLIDNVDEWLPDLKREFMQHISGGKMVLYRGMRASPKLLQTVPVKLGRYWSYDEAESSGYSKKGGQGGQNRITGSTAYLLTVQVAEDQVDWPSSLAFNLSYGGNGEVHIRPDARLLLIGAVVNGRPLDAATLAAINQRGVVA